MGIILPLFFAIFARWNDRLRPLFLNLFQQGVTVISLVRNDRFAGDAGNERRGLANVARLPCGEDKAGAMA